MNNVELLNAFADYRRLETLRMGFADASDAMKAWARLDADWHEGFNNVCGMDTSEAAARFADAYATEA